MMGMPPMHMAGRGFPPMQGGFMPGMPPNMMGRGMPPNMGRGGPPPQ